VVTGVTDFGAFVRLEEGVEGLVYSSEIAAERVEKAADHVKEGETVRALVMRVDPAEQKISLSMKAVHDKEERAALRQLAQQQSSSQKATLGDLLATKLAQRDAEGSSDKSEN
jgi:small subunit ribosomal protein S1